MREDGIEAFLRESHEIIADKSHTLKIEKADGSITYRFRLKEESGSIRVRSIFVPLSAHRDFFDKASAEMSEDTKPLPEKAIEYPQEAKKARAPQNLKK